MNALYEPAVGCVITICWPVRILPPPTGTLAVLARTAAGSYKAFTAVCTHQGCIVSTVADGTIDCPCHGSKFSVKDGSVVNGPAPSPLAPVAIKVQGTSIVRA